MKRRHFLAAGALALLPWPARAQQSAPAMRFSALAPGAALPPEYRVFSFGGQKKRTDYALVEDEGVTVLSARAEASASGIVRHLSVDPAALPFLSWRWKALRLPAKGDLRTKAGDDFAARLFVTFDLPLAALSFEDRLGVRLVRLLYGAETPAAALCYVWASRAPVGTVAPSAYTGRVRLVVVESGAANLGRWRAYQRDVAADYRRAFGAAPPPVSGVVVSTDSDNTGESAQALYGDVAFTARPTS